ncbi:hypothetical protein J5X84_16990 [Streptosporangiaceae bacterium NEAU-GS5]|nr:hypothetical protein [Streptosporangiaceae bacterium NEAU-GS5]
MKDNLDLATSARELADSEQPGTLNHAAATSVAITCATTRNLQHARQTLGGVSPASVRDAAINLLDRLAG